MIQDEEGRISYIAYTRALSLRKRVGYRRIVARDVDSAFSLNLSERVFTVTGWGYERGSIGMRVFTGHFVR